MHHDPRAYTRYALYYAPPSASPLARFGAAWLGWDPEAAAPVARLEVDGLPAPIDALTARASRYGFHATLKAPFRLSDNETPESLIEALTVFTATTPPVVSPPLAIDDALGFVALRPSAPSPALDALAARLVEKFDRFRAPSTPAELTKRRAARLTPEQDAHLVKWGYPYVFDAFGSTSPSPGAPMRRKPRPCSTRWPRCGSCSRASRSSSPTSACSATPPKRPSTRPRQRAISGSLVVFS